MMHVMDMHPGMKILGSDGDFVGAVWRGIRRDLMRHEAGGIGSSTH